MAILELKNVRYSYNSDKKSQSRDILRGVDAQFEQGTFYSVIGKSGSGKSTLLSLMAGLDLPKDGQVLFDGTPTGKLNLNVYRRRNVAVIYQNFSLFPLLTALENIIYPMELCHVPKKEARAKAVELAHQVALPDTLLDRYPSRLSGGEQQRVAIARALTMERRLILADEPTGNLDGENSDNIIALLSALAHERNMCVIVVTHDITVMESADVVLRFTDGILQPKTENHA
ncbi:MAG: ABC transporter ATP-binding protein [Eubacteriales bacterium]